MKSLPFHTLMLTTCLLLFSSVDTTVSLSKLSKPDKAEAERFASFLSQFPHVQLPYEMELNDIKVYEAFKDQYAAPSGNKLRKRKGMTTALKRTPYIPELSRGRFGRMGPPVVEPVARFYSDDHSITVIYRSTPQFGNEFTSFYQMIRYRLNGKVIPFKQDGYEQESLAIGHTRQREAIMFRVDPNGNIWQRKYELSWQKQTNNGQFQLKLKGQKLVESNLLKIDDKGIVTLKSQKPSRDRV